MILSENRFPLFGIMRRSLPNHATDPRSGSADHIRQQAEEARAFDRLRQFALLLGRHRGDSARHDLAAPRHVALQQLDVLVVDLRRTGAGERAGLATTEKRSAGATAATTTATL